MKIKVLQKHCKDCSRPGLLYGEIQWRDKRGGNRRGVAYVLWLVFYCADADCSARIAIPVSEISAIIEAVERKEASHD